MNEKRALLLSAFDKLSHLLLQYGMWPSAFWSGFNIDSELYPEIPSALERAFELYEDDLVTLSHDKKLITLEHIHCGDKPNGERSHCLKRVRMLIALEDHMILNWKDVLDTRLWDESPILIKHPEVRALLDENQLFDTRMAQVLDEESLQYKTDLFFYHPALTFHFLRRFSRYCSSEISCQKKVALDPRRIIPARRYPIRLLEEYWYGPKFNLYQVDKPIHEIQLTVHTRLNDSIENLFGQPLERTEFMWSMRNSLKTFQVEELFPLAADERAMKRVIVRYVHAIRDTERHAFVHLDGALRWYSPKNYIHRFNSKLTNHPNADGYFKLFRIDGGICDQDWLDLIANFYSGNELIHEYFEQPI